MSRRVPRLLLPRTAALSTATLVLAVGLVVAPPASACGCGGFVAQEAVDVQRERAVVSLADGTERVLIGLDAVSEAPDAALLVPTPEPATLALGATDVFDALEELSAPVVTQESRWFPPILAGSAGAGAGPDGASPVEVFEEVTLGPLQAASIRSDDPEALTDWLAENGYQLSTALAAPIQEYVEEGWAFVAVRLAPEQDSLDGELPPLELTFPSDELVYPMRMSAAAAQPQRVRTYVVADTRMDRTDEVALWSEVVFAGPLDAARSPALAAWAEPFGDQAYVTTQEQYFGDPATEIVEDFTYAPPDGAGDHREHVVVVVDRMIGPFYAGPVLVVVGLLVLAGGIVALVVATARRGARRRA